MILVLSYSLGWAQSPVNWIVGKWNGSPASLSRLKYTYQLDSIYPTDSAHIKRDVAINSGNGFNNWCYSEEIFEPGSEFIFEVNEGLGASGQAICIVDDLSDPVTHRSFTQFHNSIGPK